jgi:hypothetical protein
MGFLHASQLWSFLASGPLPLRSLDALSRRPACCCGACVELDGTGLDTGSTSALLLSGEDVPMCCMLAPAADERGGGGDVVSIRGGCGRVGGGAVAVPDGLLESADVPARCELEAAALRAAPVGSGKLPNASGVMLAWRDGGGRGGPGRPDAEPPPLLSADCSMRARSASQFHRLGSTARDMIRSSMRRSERASGAIVSSPAAESGSAPALSVCDMAALPAAPRLRSAVPARMAAWLLAARAMPAGRVCEAVEKPLLPLGPA